MSVARGFLAEIRFIPMSLNLLTALFGMTVAVGPGINWFVAILVLLNGFLFLYTAHLNDTFWDLKKGEYESNRKFHDKRQGDNSYLPRLGMGLEIPNAPLLERKVYLSAMLICSAAGIVVAIYIMSLVSWLYLPMALVGLALALTYSAGLDKIPALGDTMWELGVITCLFCGYFSQKGTLDLPIFQLALVLFIALLGIKILDGWYDVPTDAKIGKMTLPVYLNTKHGISLEHIRDLGYGAIYFVFLLLYFQLPQVFYVGITAGLLITAFSHFYFRGRDMKVRLGITIGGIGILTFIAWSILVTLGLIA